MSRFAPLVQGRFFSRVAPTVAVIAAFSGPIAASRGADVDDPPAEAPQLRVFVEGGDQVLEPQPQPAGNGGLLRLFRGFFAPRGNEPNAAPNVLDDADGPMPDDPEKAAAWQQRQEIRQQAAQFVQLLRPALQAELELVRNACGDEPLSAEARKQVLTAGSAALKQAATDVAAWQMGGGMGIRKNVDPRRTIREAVGRAVKAHLPAEVQAAYERQVALRSARRERAARNRIVLMIDRQLELTPEQQARIDADLEAKWDPGWPWTVDGQGMQINGYRPAPDYAGVCVTPHLDDRQRAAWKKWCAAAGVRTHGLQDWNQQWRFDGQGLDADAWWGK